MSGTSVPQCMIMSAIYAVVCSPMCRDRPPGLKSYGISAGLLSGAEKNIGNVLCGLPALAGLNLCFMHARECGLALQSALARVVFIGLASYHALGPCLSASWIPANVGGLSITTVRLSCLSQYLVSTTIQRLRYPATNEFTILLINDFIN